MRADELQPSAAVGQQPVQRGRTGPQRRRAEHERLLLDDLILVEQHHHQTGAAAEAAEQRALADARGHGDVVGRDASGPRSAIRRRAASRRSARLRAASPRSWGAWSVTGSSLSSRGAACQVTAVSFSSAGMNRTAVRLGCARIEGQPKGTWNMSDIKVLVLVGSLRAASVNRQLAELAIETAPDGVSLQLFDRLGELPFYNEDIDNEEVAEPVVALRAGRRRGRRRAGRHPRIQRQHSGCPQERDRLAVAAVRRQRAEGQADGGDRCQPRPVRRRVGARRDAQVVWRSPGPAWSRISSCRCPSTALDGKHPRENAEVAANLRDIVGKLAAEVG